MPPIFVSTNAEMDQTSSKDTISIDQKRTSIRSYGAPMGSVDTPPDSIHEKHLGDSLPEPPEDYAPSASLQVHAGKDDESSLSEVDSAAAIRHKPWTSGHFPHVDTSGKSTPIHPTARRSDTDEKVQEWLKSTQTPDPQSGTQENPSPPPQQQRRRSTIQTLKLHLLHGKFGSGFGKLMNKNETGNNGDLTAEGGRQELETLGNSDTEARGLGK
ncbi:unnamed protein product [Umbelopsis sp. WA50703]